MFPVQFSRQTRVGQGGAGCRPSVHRGLPWERSLQWIKKQKQMSLLRKYRISPCAGWGYFHNSFRHRPHRPQKRPKGAGRGEGPISFGMATRAIFLRAHIGQGGTNSSSTQTLPGAEQLRAPHGGHRPGRATERGEEATPTPASSVSLGKGKAQWAVTAAATSFL